MLLPTLNLACKLVCENMYILANCDFSFFLYNIHNSLPKNFLNFHLPYYIYIYIFTTRSVAPSNVETPKHPASVYTSGRPRSDGAATLSAQCFEFLKG